MTKTDLRKFYEERKEQFGSALGEVNGKINIVSNVRLFVALLFLALLYFGFSYHNLFYLLPVVLTAFIILVQRHAGLFRRKTHLENLFRIQKYEVHGLDGDFSHNSSGSEFINVHHPYSHDLDVFGEGSIFQYINRSNTRGGKSSLANRLSVPPKTKEEIIQWQEAIAELCSKTDFRHEVQALSMQIDEQPHDQRQLQQWLDEPLFLYGKRPYRVILTLFPFLTISLVLIAFFVDGWTPFAILAAGMQWVFLGFHLKRVNAFHQNISRKKNTLDKYAAILYFLEREKYASSAMGVLGERAGKGDEKVRQLASLLSAFDARLNSMTNLFVNSLLLYDLQCVYRLEKWKTENAGELLGWLDVVHETEVLCSFGTFAFNHPRFVFPAINDEQKLSTKGMGHPLLTEDKRVVNDLDLDDKSTIMIITGANMAGKSTFLRALGVNVVLALAGAPTCTNEFHCPLIEIRSGMRTADSLRENQSYFYAELDRLKSIMDELREGKVLLVLLDEILKGTNSTDKQAGSIALVKQFVDHSCLVLIATHDIALGELEQVYPGRITNYSFEANIENDQLFFDYKLKRGIAQKMNATFLMRKMGIIHEN